MCMLLNSHVCQIRAGESKSLRPNISDVVPDFIHSRWGERGWGRKTEHGGGREGEKVWTNSPSHRQGWLTPPSFNTNQSQTCQLDSTCTFPARVPLPDKSLSMATHRTWTLPLRQLTRQRLVLPVDVMTKVVYWLSCFISQSWWEIWHTTKAIQSGTHIQVKIL